MDEFLDEITATKIQLYPKSLNSAALKTTPELSRVCVWRGVWYCTLFLQSWSSKLHRQRRWDKVQSGESTVVFYSIWVPKQRERESGTGGSRVSLSLQVSVCQVERGKTESWKNRTGLIQSECQENTEGLEES